MPRALRTPRPLKTAHFDTIDAIALQIAYDSNMQVSLPATKLTYAVSNRDAQGAPVEQQVVDVPWLEVPKAVQKDLRALLTAVIKDAESRGVIGEGDDSGDLT